MRFSLAGYIKRREARAYVVFPEKFDYWDKDRFIFFKCNRYLGVFKYCIGLWVIENTRLVFILNDFPIKVTIGSPPWLRSLEHSIPALFLWLRPSPSDLQQHSPNTRELKRINGKDFFLWEDEKGLVCCLSVGMSTFKDVELPHLVSHPPQKCSCTREIQSSAFALAS